MVGIQIPFCVLVLSLLSISVIANQDPRLLSESSSCLFQTGCDPNNSDSCELGTYCSQFIGYTQCVEIASPSSESVPAFSPTLGSPPTRNPTEEATEERTEEPTEEPTAEPTFEPTEEATAINTNYTFNLTDDVTSDLSGITFAYTLGEDFKSCPNLASFSLDALQGFVDAYNEANLPLSSNNTFVKNVECLEYIVSRKLEEATPTKRNLQVLIRYRVYYTVTVFVAQEVFDAAGITTEEEAENFVAEFIDSVKSNTGVTAYTIQLNELLQFKIEILSVGSSSDLEYTPPNTDAPTKVPTETPSAVPTVTPSETPSAVPTVTPSETPSAVPTVTPSETPSAAPSCPPESEQSCCPAFDSIPGGEDSIQCCKNCLPSFAPTVTPSSQPSAAPPSEVPTFAPVTPSSQPSAAPPSEVPTFAPSESYYYYINDESAVTPTDTRRLTSSSCTATFNTANAAPTCLVDADCCNAYATCSYEGLCHLSCTLPVAPVVSQSLIDTQHPTSTPAIVHNAATIPAFQYFKTQIFLVTSSSVMSDAQATAYSKAIAVLTDIDASDIHVTFKSMRASQHNHLMLVTNVYQVVIIIDIAHEDVPAIYQDDYNSFATYLDGVFASRSQEFLLEYKEQLALAGLPEEDDLKIFSDRTPTFSPSSSTVSSSSTSNDGAKLSDGATAGIVVAALFVLSLMIFVGYYYSASAFTTNVNKHAFATEPQAGSTDVHM